MNLLQPGWTSGKREVNGLSLHVVEAGPADESLLILLNGFRPTLTSIPKPGDIPARLRAC